MIQSCFNIAAMTPRQFLKDKAFNRAEFARRLGIDRSRMSDYVKGKADLTEKQLNKLKMLLTRYGYGQPD